MFLSDSHDDSEALARALLDGRERGADFAFFLGDGLDKYDVLKGSDRQWLELLKGDLRKEYRKFLRKKGLNYPEKVDKREELGLRRLKATFDESGIPYYVIDGNHDDCDKMREVFGESYISEKSVALGGVKISGFGGEPNGDWLSHTMIGNSETDPRTFRRKRKEFLLAQSPDIAIVHAPPRNYLDSNSDVEDKGDAELSEYLKRDPPELLFCGHIHRPSRTNGDGRNHLQFLSQVTPGSYVVNTGGIGRFYSVVSDGVPEKRKHSDWGFYALAEILPDRKDVEIIGVREKGPSYSVEKYVLPRA